MTASASATPVRKLLEPWNKLLIAMLGLSAVLCVAFLAWMASTVGALSCTIDSLKTSMPREYVTLERYNSDRLRMEGQLDRIEKKLDDGFGRRLAATP